LTVTNTTGMLLLREYFHRHIFLARWLSSPTDCIIIEGKFGKLVQL